MLQRHPREPGALLPEQLILFVGALRDFPRATRVDEDRLTRLHERTAVLPGAVDDAGMTLGTAVTVAAGASLFDERFGLADRRPASRQSRRRREVATAVIDAPDLVEATRARVNE